MGEGEGGEEDGLTERDQIGKQTSHSVEENFPRSSVGVENKEARFGTVIAALWVGQSDTVGNLT
jgi:hypothetical protein